MVEFAISAIILLTAIFGIVDFSRALYVYHFVSYAAQQGTRYAMVRGAGWSGTSCTTTSTLDCDATATDIQNYVQSLAPPGITASNLVVTTTWPGSAVNSANSSQCTGSNPANSQGCLVKVKVTYSSFSFLLPFLPHPTNGYSFSATSEITIQK